MKKGHYILAGVGILATVGAAWVVYRKTKGLPIIPAFGTATTTTTAPQPTAGQTVAGTITTVTSGLSGILGAISAAGSALGITSASSPTGNAGTDDLNDDDYSDGSY